MNPNFSRLFNRHAWSDDPAFDELTEAVFVSLSSDSHKKLIGKSNNKGSVSPQTILKVVLVDQYLSYKQNPKLCTAFSRKTNSWIKSSQYNGLEIPRKIIDVVNALIEAEYLNNEYGYFYKKGDPSNKTSRIQHTEKLRTLFDAMDVSPSSVDPHHKEETIILRDKDDPEDEKAKDVEYKKLGLETHQVIEMRREVEAYNTMMQRHYVDVVSLAEPMLERETTNKKTGEVETQIIHIHPSNLFTRRIFSRGQFNKHGRWYGGFWQQLPKKGQDLRKDIYIDDEPTDEIDFSGLHPTLLALKKGHKIEGDRYDLGYQVCSTIPLSKQRDIVKRLVLIAINAKSRQKAFGAYNSNNEPVKARDLAKLLDALVDKHPYLEDDMCTDKGIDLMYTDSQITAAVIRRFVELDKPILPVHDSYIVKVSDRTLLKEVMKEACVEVVGQALNFDSEYDERQSHISHATHYRLTDYEYYETVRNSHNSKVTTEYKERYRKWVETNQ